MINEVQQGTNRTILQKQRAEYHEREAEAPARREGADRPQRTEVDVVARGEAGDDVAPARRHRTRLVGEPRQGGRGRRDARRAPQDRAGGDQRLRPDGRPRLRRAGCRRARPLRVRVAAPSHRVEVAGARPVRIAVARSRPVELADILRHDVLGGPGGYASASAAGQRAARQADVVARAVVVAEEATG